MTLVAPPKTLDVGSWVGQGLDCFGGGLKYRMTVAHPGQDKRLRVSLPQVACSAAAIHVNGKTFILPWHPFSADVTDALAEGDNDLLVEVIGGRRNILGPLHTPITVAEGADEEWTGSGHFDPRSKDWTANYFLTDHGLMAPVMVEVLAWQSVPKRKKSLDEPPELFP